ncbi:MAG: gfo/Idh/MocA family oxidoreductase, partial [bacterium]
DKNGKQLKTFGGGGNHFRGFIDAVFANDPVKVTAPPAEGHLSASLCHLANVSYRTGEPAGLGAAGAPFGHEIADEAFGRMRDHLKAQGVDPARAEYRRGRAVVFDGVAERIPADAQADALLTREYRKPFTLPALG